MRQVNITFEDKDYSELSKIKEIHGGNWMYFIIDIARFYRDNKTKVVKK